MRMIYERFKQKTLSISFFAHTIVVYFVDHLETIKS
jgi:hypothetical protein